MRILLINKKAIGVVLWSILIFSNLSILVAKADGISGWNKEGQAWKYYINGEMKINYWIQDSVKQWYYIGSDGVMKTNAWIKDSAERWYYLGNNGIMQKGWKYEGGKWYYLNAEGAMLSNQWLKLNGSSFYFNKNGEMEIESIDAKTPPKIALDFPKNNSSIKDSFNISGWTLNNSGVKEVKIYIDDIYIGNATTGISREDVNKAFPGYMNGDKSGYSYNVDINTITAGTHNIKIQSIGNNGTSIDNIIKINIVKLPYRIAVDFPKENTNIETSFSVSGWALNPSSVKSVEVYVDDVYKGDAYVGISRLDIKQAFPDYKGGEKSGYNFPIDIDTIKVGVRNIKVKVKGYDGSITESSRNVNIVKIPSKMALDFPKANTEIKSNFKISGWVLNASGINGVNIYVDDIFMGKAEIGLTREDVNKVYPGYRSGDKGGYCYDLSVYNVSLGKHIVKIEAIGVDGELINSYVSVNVLDNTKRFVSSEKTVQQMIDLEYAKSPKYGTGREATKEEVAHYVNPNNFINDEFGKYMFMKLSYMEGVDVNDLNLMLKGKGVLAEKGQVFKDAGKANGINPIYLIAHALLETGDGTSKLCDGSLSYNATKVYNAYGVGAIDSNPNYYGSKYAYEHGWTSIDAAINGGAEFISTNYIKSNKYNSKYQDTLYKMRWNDEQMWHQYATDITWAYQQITDIKKLIDMCTNSTNYFEIPIYK
ncbi:Ig-like domain-containing protein [Clostridium grantii]|nr:Ig-like domain-containing protein [Clostridium grantii]